MSIISVDNRVLPLYDDIFWRRRKSRRQWLYCRECHRDTPHYTLIEGHIGSRAVTRITTRCWECDYSGYLGW